MTRLRRWWLTLAARILDRVIALIALVADTTARPNDWVTT